MYHWVSCNLFCRAVRYICCVLWLNDTSFSKMHEEVNRNTTVQVSTPTPTLSATMHIITDRQTDRRQYHANRPNRSNCVQHAVRLAKSINVITMLLLMMLIDDSAQQWPDAAAGRPRWSSHGTRLDACRHRRPHQVWVWPVTFNFSQPRK